MVAPEVNPYDTIKRPLHLSVERPPINVEIVAGQRELGLISINWIAVDGETGRVRSTVSHLNQHGRKKHAEAWLKLYVLQIKTYNTAHGRILRVQI